MRTLAYFMLCALQAALCVCGCFSLTFMMASKALEPTIERMRVERKARALSRRRLYACDAEEFEYEHKMEAT